MRDVLLLLLAGVFACGLCAFAYLIPLIPELLNGTAAPHSDTLEGVIFLSCPLVIMAFSGFFFWLSGGIDIINGWIKWWRD
jgi:hypothetical protein